MSSPNWASWLREYILFWVLDTWFCGRHGCLFIRNWCSHSITWSHCWVVTAWPGTTFANPPSSSSSLQGYVMWLLHANVIWVEIICFFQAKCLRSRCSFSILFPLLDGLLHKATFKIKCRAKWNVCRTESPWVAELTLFSSLVFWHRDFMWIKNKWNAKWLKF